MPVKLSRQMLQRLPQYASYLGTLPPQTCHISATSIAAGLGLHQVQVRKDLAAVSSGGRPKTGYKTSSLLQDIRSALNRSGERHYAIVGMGNLGRALAQHKGFEAYNLHLAALFDTAPSVVGKQVNGLTVQPMAKLAAICREKNVEIGIIAVPPHQAQQVCGMLAGADIKAVWNFAPVRLKAPAGVLVANEDMVASLGILSCHVKQAQAKKAENCSATMEALTG